MPNHHDSSLDKLFEAIASIDSADECRAFFEDLCTIKEIQDMAQRFDTALLLDDGLSYQKISDTVKVSTATICRVNRALVYGSDGYRRVIDRIKNKETENDDQ